VNPVYMVTAMVRVQWQVYFRQLTGYHAESEALNQKETSESKVDRCG